MKTVHLCKAQKRHFSHLLSPGEKILGRILPSSVTYGKIKHKLKTLSNLLIPWLFSERVLARHLRVFFSSCRQIFLFVCLFSWATSLHPLSRIYFNLKTFSICSFLLKTEMAAGNRGIGLPFFFFFFFYGYVKNRGPEMAINCFYIYSVSVTRDCDLSSRRRHPKEGNYCDHCLWRPGLCTTPDI